MTWEIIFLGVLILTLGVSAIIMAARSKSSSTTIVQGGGVDVEKLAASVASAVGKEMAAQMTEQLREIMENLPAGARVRQMRVGDVSETVIEMDESIIPIRLGDKEIQGSLEGMAKEEIKVDKDLNKSKSKLQALLGKKKNKE